MSKKLILGDLHFGEHNSSELFMNHQKKVLDEVIQYCLDNNINNIIQTGDLFDVRKSTTTKAIHFWKKNFFDVLETNNITLDVIIGNHDMYYKNTITPNTITEILSHYRNINIYENITEKDGILFVPWICEENKETVFDGIKNSKAKLAIGHLEINGAVMQGSSLCDDGIERSLFSHFDLVISGHFHIKGTYGNIEYVGTPYQSSWSDYGEAKGFHLIDSDNNLEFIELPHELFYRFQYNDSAGTDIVYSYLDELDLKDKFIKLVIEHREDFKFYDKLLNLLNSKEPFDLKIIEPLMDLNHNDSDVKFDGELIIKKTEDLITDYISDVYPEKSIKLNKLMLSTYKEARIYD